MGRMRVWRNPKRNGYMFTGWSCSWSGFSGSSSGASFTMPAQNVTLTANFTKKDTGSSSGFGSDTCSITFVDEFYTGSTYDGQGNGKTYSKVKGTEYSFTTGSTNSYTYNGTGGYHCTRVEVSPAGSGLSVSGLTVSGTITGDVTITRTMVRTGSSTEEPEPTQTPEGPETETYHVTVIAKTGGSASGGGSYEAGETVFISANAKYGYEFD